MFRFIIFFVVFPLSFALLQPSTAFAQRKVKVVKVRTQGAKKQDDEHFQVSKQGKEKNDKVTSKGRRFSNHNEAKTSVKKQKKRDKQLEKRRKNPSKKYTASANPKTKDAKKFNKKSEKGYKTQKKEEKKAKKSRKKTMKFNRKLSGN